MANTPIPPIGLPPQSPAQSSGQVVQIVSIPDALRNAAASRPVRTEGEVVQQNKDGSVRIRTPQGDMDVQVRGRQPQAGQKVELDIAAGSRTATLRPAPAQPAPPPLPQTPPVTGQPVPQPNIPLPQTPPTRPTPLPAPVPVNANGKPLPPLPTSYPAPAKPVTSPQGSALPPLTTGQIVRLTPVLPAQAQTLQQSTMPVINADIPISTQLSKTTFQADLIARTAQDSLQKTMIQTVKPTITPIPTIQPASAQAPVQPQTTQQTIAKILGAIFSNQPATPDLKISSTLPMMPSITGSTALENSITPSMPTLKPLMLDAKILEIKLPQVQILSTPSNTIDGAKAAMTDTLSASIKLPVDVLAGAAKPAGIVATVTGFTPQNLPLINIQWPNTTVPQNYILQFASGNLEPGSQLVLLPQPAAGNVPANAAGLKPLMPLLQSAMLWPAVDDIFQTLMQTSPQMAQALGKIIPSPANPSQLGASALLFIAATKAGELQNWMGDKRIDALQKIGKQSLMSRLAGEISSLTSSASNDGPATEWRSTPIPLLWQNEISKVMFHVHHDRGANEQDESGNSTRFIMDLNLTRMGDVQLDGLLREKRLDLVIRTQVPISKSMQQAMRVAYATALDGSDIYGELSFQGDLKNWMHVVKREEMFGANA